MTASLKLCFIIISAGILIGCSRQVSDEQNDATLLEAIKDSVVSEKAPSELTEPLLKIDTEYGKPEIGSWWIFQDTSGQWTLTKVVGPFMNANYEQRYAELSIRCKPERWGQSINPHLTHDDINRTGHQRGKTAGVFDLESRKLSVVRFGGTSWHNSKNREYNIDGSFVNILSYKDNVPAFESQIERGKFDPTHEVKYGFIPMLKSGKTLTLKDGPVFQLDGFKDKIKILEEKCR